MKQWSATQSKWIFPYSHFNSIEELNNCTEFPPYEAFYNELKQSNCDLNLYNQARELFNSRLRLPADHSDKWRSFADFLKFYNLSDCEPLVQSIENSFEKFRQFFSVEPLYHLSLPSMAHRAMFDNFENCSLVFSFGKKANDIRELFRNNVLGGLCNIFHRHVSLTDSNTPPAAQFAANGERFSNILFLDFNSLYLKSQQQNIPTSPGLLWKLKGNHYTKSTLVYNIRFGWNLGIFNGVLSI